MIWVNFITHIYSPVKGYPFKFLSSTINRQREIAWHYRVLSLRKVYLPLTKPAVKLAAPTNNLSVDLIKLRPARGIIVVY